MIKHLLFDLDDTLWDCAGNSVASLRQLYERHDFGKLFGTFEVFNAKYQHNNDVLWAALPDSTMTVAEVRVKRFEMTLAEVGYENQTLCDNLNDEYMNLMVRCPGTMPYADEVLKQLSEHYDISVVTNGIKDVQRGKLTASGLDKYVKGVYVSDEVGFMKPKREYFEVVMEKIGLGKSECLMIGDNPVTDIKGAMDFGISAVWYNWRGAEESGVKCRAVVHDLRDIAAILNQDK